MASYNLPQSKLGEFFLVALQEMYWSEIHLVNVLTTMAEASTTSELKEAFETHREDTRRHIECLEDIFLKLDIPARPEPSVGLQGLFDEGWQVIDESEAGTAHRDAALIIAAQKVEHYEIACYGSLVTLAKTLGLKPIAKELHKVLEEEKKTDALLTEIAEASINEEASEEPASPNSETFQQSTMSEQNL